MNTPSNKRYSSSSEYGTPGVVDDSEESLYFSFTVDDNPTNKENSINGGQWAITDLATTPSTSLHVSKTKTPLLRKVLQSNFTPRNKNNKRVSFSHLPHQKQVEETAGKISKTIHTYEHQTAMNSNTMFDLKPIEESLPCPTTQKIFDEHDTDNDINSDSAEMIDDLDDEIHNTIIENPSSVKHSTELLVKVSEKSESNACGSNEATESIEMNNMPAKHVKIVLSEAAKKPQLTRNVTKMDRRLLIKENRKSILPVSKRATTYKRRSSTYEPRKVDPRKSLDVLKQVLSKSVSGKYTIFKCCS